MFFLGLLANSQEGKDTIYFDENNNQILKDRFDAKLNSSIYYGTDFNLDSIFMRKLSFSYVFNELKPEAKSQLFSFLNHRHDIDTTRTLVIHYRKTLKNPDSFPENDSIVNLPDNRHKHLISYDTFIKEHEKCTRKFARNDDATVLHFFSENKGHPLEYQGLKWYGDHNRMIRNIFMGNKYDSYNIIVTSDGRFFSYRYLDNDIKLKHLIKDKKWDKYKAEFLKKYNALNY